jgi:uroporphyrinogen decarboxylase
MEMAAWLRGFLDFYCDVASNEELFCTILDKIVELKIIYWEHILDVAKEFVDIIQEADDLGGQNRLLISPDKYRRLVKPRHQEIFDFIHSHSNAKVFFHSCGAIREIIPDLIEIGVDILNPVQVSAPGMDSAELKQEFGKDLVFWGGGIDTQSILPYGTPQQVREEVKRRLNDFMPGGGYIFAPTHNIQADVPPENIVAMWETLKEFGVY